MPFLRGLRPTILILRVTSEDVKGAETRVVDRSTQGVRLVRMDENDQVAAACLIPEAEEKGEDDGQENLTLQ